MLRKIANENIFVHCVENTLQMTRIRVHICNEFIVLNSNSKYVDNDVKFYSPNLP